MYLHDSVFPLPDNPTATLAGDVREAPSTAFTRDDHALRCFLSQHTSIESFGAPIDVRRERRNRLRVLVQFGYLDVERCESSEEQAVGARALLIYLSTVYGQEIERI